MVKKTLALQLLTSLTATFFLSGVLTHIHMDVFVMQWSLWALNWAIAWPLAFSAIRWIGPVYKKLLDRI